MTFASSPPNASPTLSSTPLQQSTSPSLDALKDRRAFNCSPDDLGDDENYDQEAWDTALEGEAGVDVHHGDIHHPRSSQERQRARRLKGKDVEVSSAVEESSIAPVVQHTPNGNAPRSVHARHLSTPTPPSSSPASSSAVLSPLNNEPPNSAFHPQPGPSRSSRTLPSSSEHLAPPAPVPAVNIIPNSPPPIQRLMVQRVSSGSLDISHAPITPSRSQESLRRRETLGTIPSNDRRNNRHRSLDPRASNRLSGFFSNLLHMRDRSNDSPAASAPSTPSKDRPSTPRYTITTASPADSPHMEPPITPPPALPPPTLEDLGLQMTAITPVLNASQFVSPPISGVFLAPHYLLLCHGLGLDVLPLKSPPAPHPYALIRRVAFKSVLVMEERGVLVAIAGRREGVRVYALDEVRRAVEWRVQVELERERERGLGKTREPEISAQRHPILAAAGINIGQKSVDQPPSDEDQPSDSGSRQLKLTGRLRCVSQPKAVGSLPITPTLDLPPLPTPVQRRRPSLPTSPPPTYSSLPASSPPEDSRAQPSSSSSSSGSPTPRNEMGLSTSPLGPPMPSLIVPSPDPPPNRARNTSVSTVTAPVSSHRIVERDPHEGRAGGDPSADEVKRRWVERHDSDEEALDPVAAGSSGSEALDERTSAVAAASAAAEEAATLAGPNGTTADTPVRTIPARQQSISQSLSGRRPSRPSDLQLSSNAVDQPNLALLTTSAPTLMSMRQALSLTGQSSTSIRTALAPRSPRASTSLSLSGVEEGVGGAAVESPREVGEDFISIAQALAESRLPATSLPGSIMSSGTSSPAPSTSAVRPAITGSTVMAATSGARGEGQQPPENTTSDLVASPSSSRGPPPSISQSEKKKKRRFSLMGVPFGKGSAGPTPRNHLSASTPTMGLPGASASTPNLPDTDIPALRILIFPLPRIHHVQDPLLDCYLFLAILCGEAGEKIELFAGTYRSALSLSRTFILPDSPRSLELQLQGDDLVELFLVFAQNVFGLEPATVRVREVRIGRQERRAARRRAREARELVSHDPADGTPGPDDVETLVTSVVSVGDEASNMSDGRPRSSRNTHGALSEIPSGPTALPSNSGGTEREIIITDGTTTPTSVPNAANTSGPSPEELAALAAAAQFGPYTTFQQLTHAPAFPLGTIADDYMIPPTYTSYMEYRRQHEVNAPPIADLLAAPNTPAILSAPVLTPPPPPPAPPPKWFYIDPKGVVQGPWKASLMQSWFSDGFLPLDLPVRRDSETTHTLLKDLCKSAKDPDHPFRPPSPPPTVPPSLQVPQVLLSPISLLTQPKRFGPPALFFTSRGGHSTTIVDARGKSVLRGRLNWTADDETTKLGDVKRLEAFDAKGRAVIVAIRQGGLEAVDVGDALCCPGDESRSAIPHFSANPAGVSRRPAFVWRLGNSMDSHSSIQSEESLQTSTARKSVLSLKKHHGSHSSSQRPSSKQENTASDDTDGPLDEEMLYLGRHEETIYVCERTSGSFRILGMSTST
ncbi:hypothetical protein FRB99_004329 [Tulasnella sp. 403]|nr:hypothetical protein FRB99_004329 [Tulasnella sp. 403]